MKPAFEAVSSTANSSFVVRRFEEKIFSAPYHYHPEFELTLIVRGTGKRYVGTHMQDYFPGDFVLLGANLPHCWKTADTPVEDSLSIVLHFTRDCLGADFFSRPEMKGIHVLLSASQQGLQFGAGCEEAKEKMLALWREGHSFRRLMLVLDILHLLASSAVYTTLNTEQAAPTLSSNDNQRIHGVFAYIVDNFREEVSLQRAAAVANMTPPAFCKYFKRITRKTFTEAVNDYRVDFAVRQLLQSEKSVSQIGFDSGFNDISHFHRVFRQKYGVSPLQYRNGFMKA